MVKTGHIRIGIGGWTYASWRGTFYPQDLAKADELRYAASVLTALEINGTFYRSQRPETFAKWRESTPASFVFTVKAPRFATHRKRLAEAGDSVERFLTEGVGELGDKLGPILWQLPGTKRFDPADVTAFLSLLPRTVDGRCLRHAIEVRHESFRAPEMIALARAYGVAIVWAADSVYPEIADATADFHYLRLMGTREEETLGYADWTLDRWAEQLVELARGAPARGVDLVTEPSGPGARDIFCFIIGGYKSNNPAAAMALIDRIR